MKTSPPGRIILTVTALAVGISIIVALLLARDDVRSYEPGTPEATAQAFIQAMFDEDVEAARNFLSAELQRECRGDDLNLWWVRNADSARFDSVDISDDTADIEVSLITTEYEPGFFPFSDHDYSSETEIELERHDGTWVITNATWPLSGCTWR